MESTGPESGDGSSLPADPLPAPVRRIYTGHLIGITFLAIQLGLVGYARFIPERFFCWAPYDQHTWYRIEVVLGDAELTPREVSDRYRYRSDAWEPRNINNVFSIVRQAEITYGETDNARVTITYSTNGRAEEIWHWPRK